MGQNGGQQWRAGNANDTRLVKHSKRACTEREGEEGDMQYEGWEL